jgi:hypothetical protein
MSDRDKPLVWLHGEVMIMVPAVGRTSASAVHLIPHHRWWTKVISGKGSTAV